MALFEYASTIEDSPDAYTQDLFELVHALHELIYEMIDNLDVYDDSCKKLVLVHLSIISDYIHKYDVIGQWDASSDIILNSFVSFGISPDVFHF